MINRNEKLFYRAKNKKLCERKWTFVICENLLNKYRKKLLDTATKNGNRCCKNCSQKVFHKISAATGELIRHKVTKKVVEPKSAPEANTRNIEEIISPPEKRKKY